MTVATISAASAATSILGMDIRRCRRVPLADRHWRMLLSAFRHVIDPHNPLEGAIGSVFCRASPVAGGHALYVGLVLAELQVQPDQHLAQWRYRRSSEASSCFSSLALHDLD